MRLTVLIPSEAYRGNAGARIRYARLSSALFDEGVNLTLDEISQFDPRTADCDVMIVSKCYDARSLLAAKIVSGRGVPVGVDLFDDYFSQHGDSRLNRYRLWLRQMLALCDFATCSTLAMAKVIESYRPGLPIHVLNDPAPKIEPDRISAMAAEKLAAVRESGLIRIGWFGVGDNPNFRVGISDVSAFSNVLSSFLHSGWAIELTLLTNARALDADRLSMIADIPFPVRVSEWSEAAEIDLLRASFACFLPVNAQAFSIAKSLNRAMTALAEGCQVLSAGYPLYVSLDPFIYRDVGEFISDLDRGRMRHGAKDSASFSDAVDSLGSSASEGARLACFLRELPNNDLESQAKRPGLYLVHGFATNGAAHKMAQAVGGLSVKTPFCSDELSFDVVFEVRLGGGLAMLVSDKALGVLNPHFRQRATPSGGKGTRNFWIIQADSKTEYSTETIPNPSLPLLLSLYPSAMRTIIRQLEAGFGPGLAIVSETSPFPFDCSQ